MRIRRKRQARQTSLAVVLAASLIAACTPQQVLSPRLPSTVAADPTPVAEAGAAGSLTAEEGLALIAQTYAILLDQYVDSPDHVVLLRAAWDGFAAALPASQPKPEAPSLVGADPVADLRLFRTSYLAAAARAGSSRQAQARLAYAALRKMTESLDDCHTAFMDPVEAEEHVAGLRGAARFGGVGVRIKQKPNEPALVWEILPGGSAGKAGIKPGDAVIKINGQDASSLTLQQIAAAIRGPEGSQVTLTVQRSDGKKIQEFSLKRGPVVDPPFQSKTLPGNVGYFRLNSFSEATSRDLLQAVRALESKNPKGWIVDLRTNGGGDLSVVLSLMSKFLKNGPFGFEVDKHNQPSAFGPDGSYLPRQHPLVVLVSESSASGAELFAAAVQQYQAGKVIGTKTAGCVGLGSTLQLADGSALTVTTSKLLGPTQNEMNKLGLVPAEVVDVSRADLAAGRDPQLQRALAVLGAPTK